MTNVTKASQCLRELDLYDIRRDTLSLAKQYPKSSASILTRWQHYFWGCQSSFTTSSLLALSQHATPVCTSILVCFFRSVCLFVYLSERLSVSACLFLFSTTTNERQDTRQEWDTCNFQFIIVPHLGAPFLFCRYEGQMKWESFM